MNFKRSLYGYDTEQVDKYVQRTETERQAMEAQRERIEQLVQENAALKDQLTQYKNDEQAISKSLVESQKLANELKGNAEKFAEITLSRAKIFYATWQAYAKTLVASLSDEEVRQFNRLYMKIEGVINAFEGNDVAADAEKITQKLSADETAAAEAKGSASRIVVERSENSAIPSDKTMGIFANPIDKVADAAGQIDLSELVRPEQSLEELCAALGITGKKV